MARRSILNRSFSTREKVLILVLVALLLVACYYFLVVKNVADTKAENDLQLQEIQMLITPILLRRSTCRCYTVPRLADTCRCGNR